MRLPDTAATFASSTAGAGMGYNLDVLLRPHGQTFAFDLNEDSMWRARRTGRPIVRANMEHIPFASNSFDLATSFDVVQSVPDDRKALREMARILRPGGHVVLNVTALDMMRGDHSDVWGELRRYNTARASRLMADAGLEVDAALVSFCLAAPTDARGQKGAGNVPLVPRADRRCGSIRAVGAGQRHADVARETGSGAGAPRSDAVWELVADGREKPRPQAPGPRPQGS